MLSTSASSPLRIAVFSINQMRFQSSRFQSLFALNSLWVKSLWEANAAAALPSFDLPMRPYYYFAESVAKLQYFNIKLSGRRKPFPLRTLVSSKNLCV